MATFTAWHGKTLAEHVALRDAAAKDGYRFLSLSIHGAAGDPRYTAVMIKRSKIVAQRDFPSMTEGEWTATFEDQAKKKYGPVMLCATGTYPNARYAAVFQPQSPIALTRHRLISGEDTNVDTIQGMNKKAKVDGLILRWSGSYGPTANPRFTAIWAPNTDKTIWNADGLVETADEYQARFNAQDSGWARPALVAVNGSNRYLSHFVDNQVGSYVARHDMTAAKYQDEFDKWTDKQRGFFPVCVQGGGTGSSTRYAAIFVKREDPIEKEFHATGPVANAAIDNLFKQIMQDTPVRHMSVAIVRNSRLVFARGYTLAEPDYPICQPTTRFRQASVSKTIMAMAIYQLLENSSTLKLSDKVQDILKLKTPSGGNPVNNKFKDITIRHLLEHTSGIDANSFRNDVTIRDAWKAAKPSQTFHLPMTAEQTDSYIASLAKVKDPEDEQVYNNCGYYLLGRVLAKKRNRATPIEALQDFLFDPLDITRIRRARSRVHDQPADEARYRINLQGKKEDNDLRLNIGVGSSDMSDDRPLVPIGYGTEHYEKQEGCGGLSAAATDLGRILATLMRQQDTPALKRDSVEDLFNNAVACQAKFGSRAGHGFDGVSALANKRFYGQKGGSLDTSGNTLQINGDWAFACNVAGKKTVTPEGKGIYPDFAEMMAIAKTVNWGTGDLFPQYGMPTMV